MIEITLIAPKDVTDISFGGKNFKVKNGRVTVPREAAEHMYQFGFGNIPDTPAKGKKDSAPEAAS
ncbi:MAG: hypothetical protein Q4G42_05170 [Neisseria sp.]|nr:hypothetical protein [Neisseria sp.]